MPSSVAPLIELSGVHVAFGATVALADESLRLEAGEIVGLLGHNGAGKSTFVNVATGAIRPKRGTMTVKGKDVPLRGQPRVMERNGIQVIHQEPALAWNLSVADNITLGRDDQRKRRRNRRQLAREALALLDSNLNVDRPVSTLAFSERQVVALARTLSIDLRILFLDEPTGALGKKETERLHSVLRTLAQDGRGLVYVSHRLRDILEVCTRIVVLRDGCIVLDQGAETFTLAELARALAPDISHQTPDRALADSTTSLVVEWQGQRLAFRRGEIVGLFGMAAGPQFSLMEALFGLADPIVSTLDGARFEPRSPREAIKHGVYYLSADREREGVLAEMSALDNLIMPWLSLYTRGGVLMRRRTAETYREAKDALHMYGPGMHAPIGAFSGGNRQKLVLGRWLYGEPPKVLLLSQPTQGVDVGARLDITRALRELAAEGVTIIVASAEQDEIALLCDRALICDGLYWQEVPRDADWEERLLEGLINQASLSQDGSDS